MFGKVTILLALLSIACLIGGPGLARAGALPPMAGLALFALSGLLGFTAILAGTVVAIRYRAYFAALIGMLGCLPLMAVTAGAIDGFRYPPINDITTDTAHPPALTHAAALPENAGRNLTFPAENAPLIAKHYPDMKSLSLKAAPEIVHRHARAIAASGGFGWALTHETNDFSGFEAVAETRLFRWKDDVAVRIRPGANGGSTVDLRSRSREGKSDLGANARRIRRFMEALQE